MPESLMLNKAFQQMARLGGEIPGNAILGNHKGRWCFLVLLLSWVDGTGVSRSGGSWSGCYSLGSPSPQQ